MLFDLEKNEINLNKIKQKKTELTKKKLPREINKIVASSNYEKNRLQKICNQKPLIACG